MLSSSVSLDALVASMESARPAMYAVISRCGIKDRATIEDLAQDAIIKAWQNADAFQGKSKVSSWLCSIAKNTAIDHLRKHGRMVMMGDRAMPEKVDSSLHVNPEAAMIADETEQAMNDKVQTAISKGVCKLNVNTELRNSAMCFVHKAFGGEEGTHRNGDIDLLQMMQGSYANMKLVAKEKLMAFSCK